ncbi:MAG: aldehyde dehydrogenase family protein [Gaiellaceae bacterium]
MTETKEFRVTYATLLAEGEELHRDFEAGARLAETWLGSRHGSIVGGRELSGGSESVVRSPCDREVVIGSFAGAGVDELETAVAAAKASLPAWSATDWHERVALLRRVADLFSERRNELAALASYEAGKSRTEGLGEVEEAADLIRYYCAMLESTGGLAWTMLRLAESEATRSVLKPYGVWAVISPFNFPIALSTGPLSAALAAGNTAILKPSSLTPLIGLKQGEIFLEAGVPPDVLQVLVGPGGKLGDAICRHPEVAGITFTGSYETGMDIQRVRAESSPFPQPAICEMGGKNPAIVMASADLEDAALGVARSAFGMSGQKCSACSRALVQRPVYEELCERLAEKARTLRVGHPLERDIFTGPVIAESSVATFEQAAAEARKSGRLLAGGSRLREGALERGNYVELTVAELPPESRIWREELFVPFLAIRPVDTLDEALALANDTQFGLTAGFYSRDGDEIQRFLDEIEAGVVYVNRKAGATTGAWPGVQPFGGWKGSGSTGKAGGGPHYLQQYAREQSQTIVES